MYIYIYIYRIRLTLYFFYNMQPQILGTISKESKIIKFFQLKKLREKMTKCNSIKERQ